MARNTFTQFHVLSLKCVLCQHNIMFWMQCVYSYFMKFLRNLKLWLYQNNYYRNKLIKLPPKKLCWLKQPRVSLLFTLLSSACNTCVLCWRSVWVKAAQRSPSFSRSLWGNGLFMYLERGDAFPLYAPHIPESVTRPVASGRQNELSSLPGALGWCSDGGRLIIQWHLSPPLFYCYVFIPLWLCF